MVASVGGGDEVAYCVVGVGGGGCVWGAAGLGECFEAVTVFTLPTRS